MGGSWLAYTFFLCVAVITLGLLWFRVLRPMLEDLGVLRPAQGVNHIMGPASDYVAGPEPAGVPVPPFPQEREPEREPGTGGTAYEPPPLPAGKLYTPDQIATLESQAEERGAARALGLMLGRQLVDGEDRALAMELLFGPRGRRHQRVRPVVDQAAASVAPPAEAARLVPIAEGREGHFEL